MRHVVVIGAGFGGLKAVEELHARDPRLALTLIAPEPTFLYWPSFVWVPSGRRDPDELTVDVRDWLDAHGAAYHRGHIRTVRDGGRRVETDQGTLANDGLVVASGGRALTTAPGEAHTLSICAGAAAALAIRDRLRGLDGGHLAFGVAGNPEHRPAMRAGALLELVFAVDRQLREKNRRARFRLALFSPEAEVGARPGDRGVERLLARLERLGVELHLGGRIERFEADRVVTSRGEIASDLTVFMPGLTGPDWLAASELPVTASGHVAVDARARVDGLERVYAVGDSAAFPGPRWQAKQAHTAELQAETAAANLVRELHGGAPERTVRHEVINILDDLDTAAFVFRDDRGEIMLPPNPLAHYLKLGLEAKALRKYGPLRRPPRRLQPADAGA